MNTEPARLIASITGGVAALIALLVAFGVDLTEDQKTAILGIVAIAAPIIAGLFIRQNVYSTNSVKTISADQYNAGVPPTEPQPDIPPPAEAR
ncbi:MAG: hypothetical protein M3440_05095 [Chloroflexota bacterium]|nr:hypothetical protein [Chloroflexota bacterium]